MSQPRSEVQRTTDAASEIVRARLPGAESARLAVVGGSGLTALEKLGRCVGSMDYAEVPGLSGGAVAGHAGRWLLLDCKGVRAHCLLGRRHLYEGIGPADASATVRVLARLGVEILVLTNAAGGLAPRLAPGDLMLLSDQLNLMFRNPLSGPNDPNLGPRFPDMSRPFDPALAELLRDCALAEGVALQEGVYAALTGPGYESRAEVAMLRRLGADAVGMSTVPEVIAARHAGLRVAAVSLITNSHVRPAGAPSHEEVLAVAARGGERLARLLARFIERLA